MSARTIEARAIFSAQDRSGNTFQFLAKKIMGVEEATKSAQRRIEAFNKTNSRTSAMSHRAEMAAEVTSRMSGLHHVMATVAAAVTSGAVAHEIITQGAKRMHERVRMEASGMAEDEIGEATRLAAKLSSEFKPIDQTETMHMLRNARSIVGSYQEAAEIMEPLMKLRVIAQANRPGQDVSEDFDQLVKGLEIKGVTQDPAKFREYMQGIAQGLNVFGDTLKPYQYYEMFKYGRQATPGLSSDFILGTAPTLAQELGGSSYGNAVAGFNRAIVNGRMEHPSIKEMVRLGLLGHDEVDWLKNGEAKGIKGGHAIHGWQLAQSDPNEWVKQYLIPAFEKMGVSGADAMMREIGVLFSNKMAAQMVDLLATQQSRIDKDRALLHKAPGLEAAEKYMHEDFSIAVGGFRAQMENAAASIGAPLASALTPAINAASAALASFSTKIQDETLFKFEHPGERTPHQLEVQRAFNRLVFDVDSDQVGSDIPSTAFLDRDVGNERERLQRLSSPKEEKRIRDLKEKYRRDNADHPILSRLGMVPDSGKTDKLFDKELGDIPGYRKQLHDLDWSSLQRMVTEYQLRETTDQLKAAREPYARLNRHVTGTVPGAAAMPLSIGYGGVDARTMSIGNHPAPAVAMPERPPQAVKVGFDTVKIEAVVRVDASSALLNAVADAKKTATTRAFALGADTGPGGLGETGTGQH